MKKELAITFIGTIGMVAANVAMWVFLALDNKSAWLISLIVCMFFMGIVAQRISKLI
jgi:hypothetical protein